MASSVRSKVIECLRAFMRLRSIAPGETIDSWVRAVVPRRSRTPRPPNEQGRSHPFVLADAARIEVPESLRSASVRPRAGSATIPFPAHAVGAADLPATEVYKRIAHLIEHVTEQIARGEIPYLNVPDLHAANAIYDDRGNVFLGHNARQVSLHDPMGFMRILLTLELANEIVQGGTGVTKRGLYYQHQTKLPDKRCGQVDSDRALTSLSSVLQVRRKNLGFVAARRGSVYGRLVVRDGDQVIDVSRIGSDGWPVPGSIDDVEVRESNARFILLVEKHSIALRLAQSRWWDDHPCVLICSAGFPSFGAREFTRHLVETLRIPAYALADADPAGIRVALTHAHGAISTAMETPWLACDDVRWAGLYPSDAEKFGLSRWMEISMSREDVAVAKAMLHHPSDAYLNSAVRGELELLIDRGFKMELDGLANQDFDFFTGEYLPRKLFETELVKL